MGASRRGPAFRAGWVREAEDGTARGGRRLDATGCGAVHAQVLSNVPDREHARTGKVSLLHIRARPNPVSGRG